MKPVKPPLRHIAKICDVCHQPPDQPCIYTEKEDPLLAGKRRTIPHINPFPECSTSSAA